MEKNKATLESALKKLPQYYPPAEVWQNIDQELTYRKNLDQLPQYAPPEAIWEGIAAELKRPKAQIFTLQIRKVLAYAAVISGMAFAWYWLSLDKAASVDIAYSQESYQPALLVNDWNDDETAIQLVVQEFDRKARLEDLPLEGTNLKAELQELNEAKEELEQLMTRYGQDAVMVQKIRNIELERTDIIKQMATAI